MDVATAPIGGCFASVTVVDRKEALTTDATERVEERMRVLVLCELGGLVGLGKEGRAGQGKGKTSYNQTDLHCLSTSLVSVL